MLPAYNTQQVNLRFEHGNADLRIGVFAFGGTGFSLCAFPSHPGIQPPNSQLQIPNFEPPISNRHFPSPPSSLESALPDKHRVSPCFDRNYVPVTLLESALAKSVPVNSLESTLAKTGGEGFYLQ